MKKILVAIATFEELKPFFISKGIENIAVGEVLSIPSGWFTADFLICGVGSVAMASNVSRYLAKSDVHFALNLGICGSYNGRLELGQLVQPRSGIQLMEIEDNGNYSTVFESGITNCNQFPFQQGVLYNRSPQMIGSKKIMEVASLSSDIVHGSLGSIQRISEKYKPDVESMEGAAFFYSCLMAGVPFAEFRAVSNFVEPRDKSKWKLALAIENLHAFIDKSLMEFENGKSFF